MRIEQYTIDQFLSLCLDSQINWIRDFVADAEIHGEEPIPDEVEWMDQLWLLWEDWTVAPVAILVMEKPEHVEGLVVEVRSCSLYVMRDYRRMGYGTALYRQAASKTPEKLEFALQNDCPLGVAAWVEDLGLKIAYSAYVLGRDLQSVSQPDLQPDSGNISLRFADRNDQEAADTFVAIHANAFGYARENSRWMLDSALEDEGSQMFLVSCDGVDCGCGYVQPSDDTVVWLAGFGFSITYRGKGIGSRSLQALLLQMRDREYRKLLVQVDNSNVAAYRMYRHAGFTTIGCCNYYRN